MNKFPNKSRQNEATSKPSYTGRGRGVQICTFSQKPVHTIDVCFKKHNLPSYLRKTNVAQLSALEESKGENTSSNSKDGILNTHSS